MCQKRTANIVLLSHEKQVSELFALRLNKKNAEIITFNKDLNAIVKSCQKDLDPKFYEDLNLNIKSWEEYLEEAKDLFDGWKNIKIAGKEIFTEMLGYNKISLLDIDTVRYLSAHTEIIANLLFKISVIKSIIKELKPEIVITLYPKRDWERIARLVCHNENVKMIDHKRWLDNIKLYFEKKFLATRIRLFNKDLKVKIPFSILPFGVRLRSRLELFRVKFSNENSLCIDDKRAILFFMINRKYLDVVIPVVESIQRDDMFKSLVLVPAHFDASEILKEMNIPFECIDSYLTGEIIKESNRVYSDIVKRWNKTIKKQKEFKEKMYMYQELDLEDLLSKEVEETILLSANSIKNILLMRRIAKLCNVKVLITPNIAENVVKSLTAGCKEIGIPVIGIKRSTAGWTSESSTYVADKFLVAGKHAKEIFNKWGINEDKIRITGLPMFDELLSKLRDKDNIERKIRNAFGINPKFHIITYLTQSQSGRFGHQERLTEIRTIYNVVKGIDDVFMIIKIHPTESDTDVYREIAEEMGLERSAIVRNELSLDDLLLSSKIAITKNSTTGFNALIAGCKLIVVGFHDKKFSDNFFVEAGVALTATSSEELYSNIRKALTDDKEELIQSSRVNEFLENHFYKLDCKSTERIKQNIYELIEHAIKS